ncbi:NrdR family transcriptional regulator [Virgibacillus halodenitrificans]|uniref:NrdR family transcriptional regulator n=1 Tax=Virgibacillus halodenitrificans TaxID=1482 RepID=UPI0037DD661B
MKCPICEGKTRVRDTRLRENGFKRYRECLNCHVRFVTYEKVDLKSVWEVVK